MQSDRFSLCRHEVKIPLGRDNHFLDDVKHLLILDHVRKHVVMARTPGKCPIVEITMDDLEVSYDKRLTDDRAGDDCQKNRESIRIIYSIAKNHESIIHAAILLIKTLWQVIFPVLNIRLGIVLKLYQILLAKTK